MKELEIRYKKLFQNYENTPQMGVLKNELIIHIPYRKFLSAALFLQKCHIWGKSN